MSKSIENQLVKRSGNACEICGNTEQLSTYAIEGMDTESPEGNVLLCKECKEPIDSASQLEGNQWRSLNDSMWSEVDAVKVLSYRTLQRIEEQWANEALEMLYIEDDLLAVAKSTMKAPTHFDANGNPLQKGDSVVLIKDLDVKGSNLTAKRGTAVRNISLAKDDPSHIVGKVEGQTIYIKTEFVKK